MYEPENSALDGLQSLLEQKEFKIGEAQQLLKDAKTQRERLLREVCDLNVRLTRYRANHNALMEAVTDITDKNAKLRNTVISLGGTV
jgi:predicted  nucleic acid-binding Zn-ribbon protein